MKPNDSIVDIKHDVRSDTHAASRPTDRGATGTRLTRRAVLGSLSVAAVSAAVPACRSAPEGAGAASGDPGATDAGARRGPAAAVTDPLHDPPANAIAAAVPGQQVASLE